jgi:hypothetical protein
MVFGRFHLKMKSKSISYLFNESEDRYWILDLEGEVHSIWDLHISGLWECKGTGFSKVGRASNNFWSGPKNLDIREKWLPLPESTSPEKVCGGKFNFLLTFVFTSNIIKVNNKLNIFLKCFFPNLKYATPVLYGPDYNHL